MIKGIIKLMLLVLNLTLLGGDDVGEAAKEVLVADLFLFEFPGGMGEINSHCVNSQNVSIKTLIKILDPVVGVGFARRARGREQGNCR